MRSKFLSVAVLSVVMLFMHATAEAQYGWTTPGGYQSGYSPYGYSYSVGPQTSAYGYYMPVLVGEDGEVVPADYSLRVSDSEDGEKPAVEDCAAGCGCDSCVSRAERGCRINCSCVRCRGGQIFQRSFASMEYLFWWNKGINLPPLVTSNVGGIPPQADAGVLGLPTTSILFGNEAIDDSLQNGMRLTFGWWLDDCCNLAVAAKLYGLEGGVVNFSAASQGDPVLGRPFFNSDPTVNGQDALLVAYPGLTSGTIDISAANDVMGAEIMGRSLVDSCDDYRLDLVGGYQFARIDSDLTMVSQHSTGVADFTFADLFEIDNQFHGGFGGLYGEMYRGMFTISALGKIGLGNMRQVANVQGFNTVTAGGSVTTAGGLYTQPTNIGVHRQDVLTWSPEANLRVSCRISKRISASVGYSFLYFTRVAFAGDHIDTTINGTQLNGGALVGAAQPGFAFRDTDFWIQTIDLGLAWEY